MSFSLREEKELSDFFRPLLNKIESISLVNWSASDIREKFGKQSLNQILESKELFYMQACSPLTLVLKDYMEKESVSSVLVVEELFDFRYGDFGLHFGLEFDFLDSSFFVHFKELKNVEVGKGSYVSDQSRVRTEQVLRFNGVLDPDKNLFENGRSILGSLKYFDLDKQVNRMISHNSNPDVYARSLSYINSGFGISFLK
ncbi:hypothetical protein KO361_00420 [Candidatus Woesearchaeota archaeon]|nr:hypothetical protein [Candidatus Woesearchaeota archaeon]